MNIHILGSSIGGGGHDFKLLRIRIIVAGQNEKIRRYA